MIPISAKTGEGVEALLETVSLVAEVTDILAQPDRLAAGTVIEAHLDRSRGPIATLLVQNGTLRIGDFTVAGAAFGKARIPAYMHSFSMQPMSSPHVSSRNILRSVFLRGLELRELVFLRELELRWPRH
jgi:translation initiation factor IF-2